MPRRDLFQPSRTPWTPAGSSGRSLRSSRNTSGRTLSRWGTQASCATSLCSTVRSKPSCVAAISWSFPTALVSAS